MLAQVSQTKGAEAMSAQGVSGASSRLLHLTLLTFVGSHLESIVLLLEVPRDGDDLIRCQTEGR